MRIKLPMMALVCIVSACSTEAPPPANNQKIVAAKPDTTPAKSAPDTENTVAPDGPRRPPSDPSKDTANVWVVTTRGINWMEAGMSIATAKDTTHNALTLQGSGKSPCEYATLKDAGPGIWVMLTYGKIARVEVRSGATATTDGAKIGDTEDRIKAIYNTRWDETPHKYLKGGHYITIKPTDPTESMFRTVFETDGKTVTSFRSGKLPEVAHVEGCS